MSPENGKTFYLTILENGWTVGRFGALDAWDAVVHMVTTRASIDPAAVSQDHASTAQRVAEVMGLESVAFCEQIHGKEVVGADSGGLIGKADGIVTNSLSLGVMGFSADCPIILAVDPVSGAVGMAHASWRGTVGRIASELVLQMVSRFDATPSDLVACIGPSAGPCCYEVGWNVFEAVVGGLGRYAERFFQRKKDKLIFDLWASTRDELIRSGVADNNVHCAEICTICRNDYFPSYRAEGQAAGRFVSVIARK